MHVCTSGNDLLLKSEGVQYDLHTNDAALLIQIEGAGDIMASSIKINIGIAHTMVKYEQTIEA